MKQILNLIMFFIIWTVIGILFKVFFVLFHHSLIGGVSVYDLVDILYHGVILDFAIAGYFSIIAGILLLISLWHNGTVLKWLANFFLLFASLAYSIANVSNIGLYGYWRFPLDNSPLLYLKTSPKDAIASLGSWELIAYTLAIILSTVFIYYLSNKSYNHFSDTKSHDLRYRLTHSSALIILTTMLIIPIRGGFGTGTNHTGSVYFSENIHQNHAAVNPLFSFFESIIHQEEIGSKYRFMEDGKATKLFSQMTHTKLRSDATKHDYNVIIICLESFSKYIMSEEGHLSGITPNLDRLSLEGIYFTNFYANSFRTDRGLVSILSGFPAQPTMSVMDIPHISTSLPSLARTLSTLGYDTHFYYGGDTNYSNMKSYIIGTGFKSTTSEADFPEKYRLSKWGVPDEYVYSKMLQDIKDRKGANKRFYKVIMTESSHEPFDVPYKSEFSPVLNAFAYADKCLGDFVANLKKLPEWHNTIVAITSDHLGAYPPEISNYERKRYEIPFIITGGVVDSPQRIDTIGSQIDICATLLGILGIDHSDFLYSKDLLDATVQGFAFFNIPDAIGFVNNDGFVYYDNTSNKIINSDGTDKDILTNKAKAFTQKLYDDLENRVKR